jgi:hypothetical protein
VTFELLPLSKIIENYRKLRQKLSIKTRLKITSVLTRVHVSICTQAKAQNRNILLIAGNKLPAFGKSKKSLQFCRPTPAGSFKIVTFLKGCRARLLAMVQAMVQCGEIGQ